MYKRQVLKPIPNTLLSSSFSSFKSLAPVTTCSNNNAFEFASSSLFLSTSLNPVSYTHLDVYKRQEERLIHADWYEAEDSSFPVNIKIVSVDRKSLLSDISMILSNNKAGIKYIKGVANKNNIAIINLTISVNTLEHLTVIMTRLRSLKAVSYTHLDVYKRQG